MLSGSNRAEDEEVNQSQSDSVILLPRRPGSLTPNSTKTQKIIHGMRPVGPKEQSIDFSEEFLVEYPVCVISLAVVYRCIFI